MCASNLSVIAVGFSASVCQVSLHLVVVLYLLCLLPEVNDIKAIRCIGHVMYYSIGNPDVHAVHHRN